MATSLVRAEIIDVSVERRATVDCASWEGGHTRLQLGSDLCSWDNGPEECGNGVIGSGETCDVAFARALPSLQGAG